MADVMIARYDAATGWLPAVCPKHGVPADRSINQKFETPTPVWVWVIAPFSLLIAALAAGAASKSEDFAMPSCRLCAGAARTRRRIRWGTGLLSLVTIVAGIGLASGGLLLLSIPVVLIWLLALSSITQTMDRVNGRLEDGWVRLRKVHPGFVAAMRPNPAWNYVPQPTPYLGGFQPAPAVHHWPPPGSH